MRPWAKRRKTSKDGLTINEVLPFFEKYKLKLRVHDVFYNLIHRYDPEVPNFSDRPILPRHGRGPHLHAEQGPGQPGAEVRGRRVAGNRFHMPEKTGEQSNHLVM